MRSGRFRVAEELGRLSLPEAPRPETEALGLGAPPVMLMDTGLFPAPAPPLFAASAPPLGVGEELPDAPGLPSGEIARRADKFP